MHKVGRNKLERFRMDLPKTFPGSGNDTAGRLRGGQALGAAAPLRDSSPSRTAPAGPRPGPEARLHTDAGGGGSPLRAGCSPQVAADGVQALLEGGHEALLTTLQGLLVPHPILQAVEDPRHAGAQRLDGRDGLGEGLQVHPGAQHPLRHLGRPGPASPRRAVRSAARPRRPRGRLGNVVRARGGGTGGEQRGWAGSGASLRRVPQKA